MIQENKTFSMQDMAHTVEMLVFAKNHYWHEARFYQQALDRETSAGSNDELLPPSPMALLYKALLKDAIRTVLVAENRLARLQGIADATMLPGLDY